MPPKLKLTKEQEQEIIQKYEDGQSTRQLSSQYLVGHETIRQALLRNKTEMRSTGNSYGLRKYTVDHNYFSEIDTAEKAYWLGFISADGHIMRKNDGLKIALQKDDYGHLEKFLKCINSNTEIKFNEKTSSVSIAIYSRTISTDLRNIGFTHDKSNSLVFPEISVDLYRHFIRGNFDGDGSIKFTKRKRVHGIYTDYAIAFSGTRMFMNSIREIISEQCAVSKPKIQQKGKIFSIVEWGGNRQVQRILDWMYGDSTIYLDRKFDIYRGWLRC